LVHSMPDFQSQGYFLPYPTWPRQDSSSGEYHSGYIYPCAPTFYLENPSHGLHGDEYPFPRLISAAVDQATKITKTRRPDLLHRSSSMTSGKVNVSSTNTTIISERQSRRRSLPDFCEAGKTSDEGSRKGRSFVNESDNNRMKQTIP